MAPRTTEQSGKIREERRAQILDAALAIFAQKGLHDTRVSEIAARAGVSQGTVYWYFKSKEELFSAVFQDRVEALFQPVFVAAVDTSLSPAKRLLTICRTLLELAVANDEVVFVFIQTLSTREVANLVTYDLSRYYSELMAVLTPIFEAHGHPQPDVAASLYTAILDGLMVRHILDPELVNPERDTAEISKLFHLEEE